jgi:hypothetical protein
MNDSLALAALCAKVHYTASGFPREEISHLHFRNEISLRSARPPSLLLVPSSALILEEEYRSPAIETVKLAPIFTLKAISLDPSVQ